jgi:hypothetical protein
MTSWIQTVKETATTLHQKTMRKLRRDKEPYKHIWSRGRELVATTPDGRHIYCDYYEWDGTLKMIKEFIKEFTEGYPDDPADEIWLECGYNGSDAPLMYKNDEYDPWIETWDLLLWKDGQFIPIEGIVEQIEQHFPKKETV